MLEPHRPTLAAYRGFTPFLIDEILKKPLCPVVHLPAVPLYPSSLSVHQRSPTSTTISHPRSNSIFSPANATPDRRHYDLQSPQDLTWNRNHTGGTTSIPTLPDPSTPSAKASATTSPQSGNNKDKVQLPAWVYCTRYSDRPSAGPRCRKRSSAKKQRSSGVDTSPGCHPDSPNSSRSQSQNCAQKRLRTAFSADQLRRLQTAFQGSHYLTDAERAALASSLQLNEAQIKIWFQNKRAKLKKNSGVRNELALQLMAEGLYNHTSTSEN